MPTRAVTGSWWMDLVLSLYSPYLLRHVLPKLTKLTATTYHITLVTPNLDFYWNIAAPRLLVSSTLIPEAKVFLPIAAAFAAYSAEHFTLVQAKATGINAESQSVVLSTGQEVPYASLVIATGASYVSPLWTLNDDEGSLKDQLRATRDALAGAKSVASARAQGPDGQTTVTLSDGSIRTVDVFIDATGGKPNTQFLPREWLSESQHVVTDAKTCRTPIPGVYAIGDVASYSSGSVMDAQNAVAPLGTSIGIDLAGDQAKGTFKQKAFRGIGATQFVPTGPGGGVGQVFGWKVPSLAVWAGKSRGYMVWMAPGAVAGDHFKKP
ncbi:putative apoptosis-inducing factor 1 [Diplocarpon rosae]|nr:putative apoptosis-inducing factor 1 [Diplocarpon rosae]